MNPVTKALAAYRIGAKQFAHHDTTSVWGAWWANRAGWHRRTPEVGNGSSSSIVTACLGVWSDALQEAPIQVTAPSPDNKHEPIPGHELVTLWERPNPHMTGDLLWHYYVWATRLDGNAYLYKERNGAGRVTELWPLRPDFMRPWPEKDPKVFQRYWEYTINGKREPLPVEDVVHLRNGINPQDYRLGLAPLKTALREILGDELAGLYVTALLSNMAIPGVVLSPKDGGAVRQPDADTLLESFKAKFGGDKAGEPWVMRRAMDVKVLSFSPTDLDLKAIRHVPEQRVGAALGVPLILAGLGSGMESSSGRNESQTLVDTFERKRVPREWQRLGLQLTYQLLPDVEADSGNRQRRVGFNLDGVQALQAERFDLWKESRESLRVGGITVAEHKQDIGKEPDPGGADDIYLRPMTAEPVRLGEDPQPAAAPAE